MGSIIKDIFYPGLDLEIAIRNLFDKDYETPGTYTTIEGDPLTVVLTLRKRW